MSLQPLESLATRPAWRPPSNVVFEKDLQRLARDFGSDQALAERHDVGVVVLARQPGRGRRHGRAPRAPWGCGWPRSRCRCPVPQTSTPRSALPAATASAMAVAEVRIVDRSRRIGAEIQHGVTRLLQVALENLLQVEAGMIRRDRDGAPRHLDDRSPLQLSPRIPYRGPRVTVPQNRGKLAYKTLNRLRKTADPATTMPAATGT